MFVSLVVGVLSEVCGMGWFLRLHPNGGRALNRCNDDIGDSFDNENPLFKRHSNRHGQRDQRGQDGEGSGLHSCYVDQS